MRFANARRAIARRIDPPRAPARHEKRSMWSDLNGTFNRSGPVYITPQSAFRIPAVSQAIQLISSELATLPLLVMREGEFDEPAPRHPAFNLLRWNPNDLYTASRFWQTMGVHLCLSGNAFAAIVRDSMGRPRGLWPLEPHRVSVFHDEDPRFSERAIAYRYYGNAPDSSVLLLSSDVLHFRWMDSRTGLVGESPVLRCSQALGLVQSTLDFSSSFFANGSHLSGVLETDGELSEEAFQSLREAWKNKAKEPFGTAVLEQGLSWKPTAVQPVDGQLVEMTQEGVNAVARIFNVPPFKLGGTSDSLTYSTELGATRDFYQTTIRPIGTEIEQEVRLKMLGTGFKAEYDYTDALRPDQKSRFESHAIALSSGFMTVDEVRAVEDLPPSPALMNPPPPVVPVIDEEEEEVPEEAERALGALRPILLDAVSRVLARQRRALDGMDEAKVVAFFEGQPASWARAFLPVSAVLFERGIDLDLEEIGGRLASSHRVQYETNPTLAELWEPAEIIEEIFA